MIKLDFKEYLELVEQGNSTGSVYGQAGRHPYRPAKPAKLLPVYKNSFPNPVATAKVDRPAAFLHPDGFRLDMHNKDLQFGPARFELSPLKTQLNVFTTNRPKKVSK